MNPYRVLRYGLQTKQIKAREFGACFYKPLNAALTIMQPSCQKLVIMLRYGGNYYAILNLMYTNRVLYMWYKNSVFPLVKKCYYAERIQFIWRKSKLSDIRDYRYLPDRGKIQMATYATLHDTRSLMGPHISEELKMKVSPFAWIFGIQKDMRLYHSLPKKIKEHPIIGLLFAKFYLFRRTRRGFYMRFYMNDIPQNIQKLIAVEKDKSNK